MSLLRSILLLLKICLQKFKGKYENIFCKNAFKALILQYKEIKPFVGPIAHSVRATDS